MIQEEIFAKVIDNLLGLNIPYMIVGAVACTAYGRPRTTHDLDLVVEIQQETIPELIKSFRAEFYVSDEGIKNALLHKSMFNIIHIESGTKADFWLLQEDEYDKERFRRRKGIDMFGRSIYMTTPEDAIIKKLIWYKESDIDKHLDDALGILEIQDKNLDFGYINKWARKLSVEKLWSQIKEG